MSSVKLLTTVKQRTDITQRAAEQRSVHCSETQQPQRTVGYVSPPVIHFSIIRTVV